ncbi:MULTISPECIES: tyrosine-type recombinase/integrase [Corynebacterium]|uniref:Tyrosine-type recombinase/integrase n=3 Tax=Corynebacterium belfantii TaxID=2014537 RepID=A0ABS0LBS1_9CORY|nr:MULTISPECIES: tyrosine-type recombinase/integrase [Corynebacterium]MBG9346292.1 tyrosine-type recombinase/integrase [Corynebacterium belfantii]MBG9354106.1 tyrosine-type recombinase/integrase [Corynebacterium belfantii]
MRYSADTTFNDEMDAYAWLSIVRKRIELGSWRSVIAGDVSTNLYSSVSVPVTPEPEEAKTTPTVGEMVEHWLDIYANLVQDSTLTTYRAILQKRVIENKWFSAIRVQDLTSRLVADWWMEMGKLYPQTRYRNQRAYQKLRSVMHLAVEYGYINSNPVYVRSAVKRPKPKRKELPTTEELRAVVRYMEPRYKLVTVLCLFHGLRIGEALGLRGRNLSPEYVTVEESLVRVPNGKNGVKMKLHKPKTQAGYRTVPILSEFQGLVRAHIEMFNPSDDDLVTLNNKNLPLSDTLYRRHFSRAKEAAGIRYDLSPHYGRVYLITKLAESGATPTEIGRILGQEDVTTIVNTYMRSRETRAQTLMQNLQLDDEE